MHKKIDGFNFAATGIGSVPHRDIEATCQWILEQFPSIPFWPQFVKRSYLEDMSIQYSEGLPLLEIREEKRALYISPSREKEEELVVFYDHFLSNDLDHFSISQRHAPGLYHLLDLLQRDEAPVGPFIKGQTVGPVTFAAGITDLNGKPVLHNPALLEALVSGLAIKALWQVRMLEKSGRKPIIFLDEPYLSGFGSAFSSIQRHEAVDILRTVIDYLKENSDALIGIHCCGNTDWPMLLEAGPHIINFDAFDYLDYFLLYPDELVRFMEDGGTVAWGIVPTSGFTGDETLEGLSARLHEGLERMSRWGIDSGTIAKRSILTPACGMGTMEPDATRRAMALLCRLSERSANIYPRGNG